MLKTSLNSQEDQSNGAAITKDMDLRDANQEKLDESSRNKTKRRTCYDQESTKLYHVSYILSIIIIYIL